jgi:superfamily II DNA/RNA helicase
VKGVSHVFNFDVPWQPDDYIHRIGRTGRAGAKGVAITLATREDAEQLAAIEKLLGHKVPKLGMPAAGPERKSERKEEPTKAQAKQPKPKAEQAAPSETPKVLADADSRWNGPLPSFLSVSAS